MVERQPGGNWADEKLVCDAMRTYRAFGMSLCPEVAVTIALPRKPHPTLVGSASIHFLPEAFGKRTDYLHVISPDATRALNSLIITMSWPQTGRRRMKVGMSRRRSVPLISVPPTRLVPANPVLARDERHAIPFTTAQAARQGRFGFVHFAAETRAAIAVGTGDGVPAGGVWRR